MNDTGTKTNHQVNVQRILQTLTTMLKTLHEKEMAEMASHRLPMCMIRTDLLCVCICVFTAKADSGTGTVVASATAVMMAAIMGVLFTA